MTLVGQKQAFPPTIGRNGTAPRAVALLASLCGSVAVSLSAQPAVMQPSPELERLQFLVGSWEVEVEVRLGSEVITHTAITETSWGARGTWLETRTTVSFPGVEGPIEVRELVTWDADAERYRWVLVDDQSPRIHRGTASWSPPGDWVMEEEPFEWQDGRTYRFRRTFRALEDGAVREVSEVSIDGGQLQLSSTHLRRRNSATEKRSPADLDAGSAGKSGVDEPALHRVIR